jgi:signal transduction histidine kinase
MLASTTAALALTIWSYHGAVHARQRSEHAQHANDIARQAVSSLGLEREAMNQYFLAPHPGILQEIFGFHDAFDATIADLKQASSPSEHDLISTAQQANEDFNEVFLSSLQLRPTNAPSQRRLALLLDNGEQRAHTSLGSLISSNARNVREREAAADRGSRNALAAALAAGLLALVGALGFVWYAVRLIRRVDRQNESLRELDRMKDDFVASVSHELRTPLTSITGYLELLTEDAGDLSETQRSYLAVVDRNSERLLQLVGDLLFVARLTGSTIELEKAPVDLTSLARHSLEVAQPFAESRSLALELTSVGRTVVDADAGRIGQVIDNLLSNALKFTPSGGSVWLRIAADDEEMRMEVADTGMGITAADQEHLFERFFRSSEALRQAIQGTGLGLSIVRALVEAHGGTIQVASENEVGTTFTVVLPVAQDAELVAA